MNELFHTVPIDGPAWALIIGTSLAVYLVVGLEKWIRRIIRSFPPLNDPLGKGL
jgi:hypothetical protein